MLPYWVRQDAGPAARGAMIEGATTRAPQRTRGAGWLTVGALVVATAGLVKLGSAVLGYRLGWWNIATAFAILQFSVYVAVVSVILGLVAVVLSVRARWWTSVAGAALAVIVGAGLGAIPVAMKLASQPVPMIHDITTDREQPPEFVSLHAVREQAPNRAAYGGPAVAAQQRSAYPDLAPLLLPVPPARAFAAAESTARALGWAIAATDAREGRLEATATTRWFGFKDDVVVRVVPALNGSRVDVRSASRVGMSDLGVNAKRVRAFLSALASRARGEG